LSFEGGTQVERRQEEEVEEVEEVEEEVRIRKR
jgi:hypothetical protein